MDQEIVEILNQLACENEPFLFVINYLGTEAYIRKLAEIAPNECLYDFEGVTNVKQQSLTRFAKRPKWNVESPKFEDYKSRFEFVRNNILSGNSYLTNLTCKIAVDCSISLDDVFMQTKGKYRLLMKNKVCDGKNFVCFSPETFVRIHGVEFSPTR